MVKGMMLGALLAVCLAACGGGGDDGNVKPTAKPLTISMYGKPLVSGSPSTAAKAQFGAVSKAATPAAAGSDAQATVQTLTEALAARGVTANITAQVMDGTTLHQIVMGENNGLPPTPDQFKADPSEWMIVNFQLDDMATPANDPAQQAAIQQFIQDLTVFSQRAAVAGKAVFAVRPIPTCDTQYSASRGLASAMIDASTSGAPLRFIGEYGVAFLFGGTKVEPIDSSPGLEHFGADCRTPDAYIQNIQVQSIADTIAQGYKEAATASAASGASATGM